MLILSIIISKWAGLGINSRMTSGESETLLDRKFYLEYFISLWVASSHLYEQIAFRCFGRFSVSFRYQRNSRGNRGLIMDELDNITSEISDLHQLIAIH